MIDDRGWNFKYSKEDLNEQPDKFTIIIIIEELPGQIQDQNGFHSIEIEPFTEFIHNDEWDRPRILELGLINFHIFQFNICKICLKSTLNLKKSHASASIQPPDKIKKFD